MQHLFLGASRRGRRRRSNGSLLSIDCSDITGWTDGDTGEAVSSQATFDGKSCFKFDSVTSADTNDIAQRQKDIGSVEGLGNRITVSANMYFDAIGALTDNDHFMFALFRSDWLFQIAFASDGLYIRDTAGTYNEVGTNLVVQDVWQEWTFDIDLSGGVAAATTDVYLDMALQTSNFDCDYESGGVDGVVYLYQYGFANDNRISYIDWLMIGDGFG